MKQVSSRPEFYGQTPSNTLKTKRKKKSLVYLFCGINREFIKIRKIYILNFYSPGVEFFDAYK